MKEGRKSRSSFLPKMTSWAPNHRPNADLKIPFSAPKSEKIWKFVDWTRHDQKQTEFSTIDRQDSLLRKNASRSIKPVLRKQLNVVGSEDKKAKYHEKQKPRESSIKVGSGWKQIEELDFSRMSSLQFMPSEPIDLYVFFINLFDGNMMTNT